jgi:hypothetical protein
MLLVAPAVRAETILCTADELTAAITAANENADAATIDLPPGCTLTTTTVRDTVRGPSAFPAIASPITIRGSGSTLRRDPGPSTPPMRFFRIADGGSLTIEDLTLTGGTVAAAGSMGGAIHANCGTLVLRRTAFVSNGAGDGGALSGCPQLTVEDSLFLGNAGSRGGAIGIFGPGGEITNTTFVGNVAESFGGGAVLVGANVPVVLRHSIIVGNRAAMSGGGVQGTVLENSIVASNTPDNCAAPIIAQERNLAFPASDTSCQAVSGPGNYVTGDPLLQPLGSYGGPTQSMRPLGGSAAVDAASGANCPPADQRGKPRPAGAACDLGAVESEQDPPRCEDAASAGPFGAVQRISLSCSDPNGYPLTYGAVAGPSSGALGAFGDGAVDYTPNAGFAGADAFTFRASNGFAAATATARLTVGTPPLLPPPRPPPPAGTDTTRPVVSDVKVAPRRFAVGDRRTPRIAQRPHRRATIRYSLSEPAAVALVVERGRAGVRLERGRTSRCVAATPRNRAAAVRQIAERLAAPPDSREVRRALRRAACPAFVRRGTLQRTGASGANRVAFTGRIGSAPLRPGAHRVVVRARDAAGNASQPRSAAFTILRPR